MKLVDGQTLDDIGDSNDEVVGTTCGYYGVDNHVYIICLVGIIGTLMKQFLDDIREIVGQRLAHLGMGVLARYKTTYRNELMKRDAIPVDDVRLGSLYQFEFLVGIIDEGAKFLHVRLAHGVAKQLVHLTLNIARSILQDVLECLVLAMNVSKKVFCTFREVQNGLKIYYLHACLRDIGKRLSQQMKILHVLLFRGMYVCHFSITCFYVS